MNLRPSGYEPDELPDCSIPRQLFVDLKKAYQLVEVGTQSLTPRAIALIELAANGKRVLGSDLMRSPQSSAVNAGMRVVQTRR